MSTIPSPKLLLTPEQLLNDETALEVGFWRITVKIQRHKIHYIIVQESKGRYTLAKARPVTIISKQTSLKQITDIFNHNVSVGEVTIS